MFAPRSGITIVTVMIIIVLIVNVSWVLTIQNAFYVWSFNLHHSMMSVLLYLFYMWEMWNKECLSNLLKVTQPKVKWGGHDLKLAVRLQRWLQYTRWESMEDNCRRCSQRTSQCYQNTTQLEQRENKNLVKREMVHYIWLAKKSVLFFSIK